MVKKSRYSLLSLIALIGSVFVIAGCADDDNLEDAAENAGEAVEDAVENTEDAAEEAADEVKDATN